VRFSRRTPADLRPNRIAIARAEARASFDLTVSNPTLVGLPYPPELLRALSAPVGLTYLPHAYGIEQARNAVAADYLRHGTVVEPERIILTSSTSEAYAFLFKLLCDPGDLVLVPTPSYPLFEHLAALEAIGVQPYRLDLDADWRLDFAAVEGAPDRVRAAVVVHPNNPTGSYIDEGDGGLLAELCTARGWALIADEVFLDYLLDERCPSPRSFSGGSTALTFTLGGLSKSIGLPQLKLSWIAMSGPPELVHEARERLEVIADSFLSVATPVQLALPELMAHGQNIRAAIRTRCAANLRALAEALNRHPALTLYPPTGGWSAVLRVPAVVPEDDLVVDLIRLDGVAVHPGYFFDLPSEGFLVVSLLPEPRVFSEGVCRLIDRVTRKL
jgi:hypothetical protein